MAARSGLAMRLLAALHGDLAQEQGKNVLNTLVHTLKASYSDHCTQVTLQLP